MAPIFRHGSRGKTFVRVPDAFTCADDGLLARGRRKAKFL